MEEGFRLPPGIPHTRTAPQKSLSKKSAPTLVSPISLKSEVNPRSGGVYSRFILAFLEQHLGNLSRNSLGTAAQTEVSAHLRTALDPVGE
jgi:hypothetical protein